jgi:hypothetical protein
VCSVEVALMCCYIHFPLKFTSAIARLATRGWSLMNFQSVVAGALALVFVVMSFWAGAASANVRIVNDLGGEVSSYVLTAPFIC